MTGVGRENTREAIYSAFGVKKPLPPPGRAYRCAIRWLDLRCQSEHPDVIANAYAAGVAMDLNFTVTGRPPQLGLALADPNRQRCSAYKLLRWTVNGEHQEQVYDAVRTATAIQPPTAVQTMARPSTYRIAPLALTWVESCRLAGPIQALIPARALTTAVLENPSCRWSTWDARWGRPREDLQATIQERAVVTHLVRA